MQQDCGTMALAANLVLFLKFGKKKDIPQCTGEKYGMWIKDISRVTLFLIMNFSSAGLHWGYIDFLTELLCHRMCTR